VALGRVDYGAALAFQRRLHELRAAGEIPDTLVLLEHPPVITLGRSAKPANLLVSEAELARRSVAVHRIERGGDVTFHGPGQLVGYPVFHLRQGFVGVRPFVDRLQQALVAALEQLGVVARLRQALVGVWVEDRKIASIGIAVKRWVTLHGFALNVTTDLSYFSLINPCGMAQVRMTSVAREGGSTDEPLVRQAVVGGFQQVFGVSFQRNLPRSLTSLTNGLSASAIDSA
jgi:lipoate-protein ligase B